MKPSLAGMALALLAPLALADSYPRQPGIDVQHYVFRVSLSDDRDDISGETTVVVRFVKDGGQSRTSIETETPRRPRESGGPGLQYRRSPWVPACAGTTVPFGSDHVSSAAVGEARELPRCVARRQYGAPVLGPGRRGGAGLGRLVRLR